MKTSELLRALIGGVRADQADYAALRDMLEAQFLAALRHDTARLAALGERITGQVEALEARRRERLALVRTLTVAPATTAGRPRLARMDDAFALLDAPSRETVQGWWQALEAQVRDCKALNLRNCQLMTDQHATMQRVLGAESDTYAPA